MKLKCAVLMVANVKGNASVDLTAHATHVLERSKVRIMDALNANAMRLVRSARLDLAPAKTPVHVEINASVSAAENSEKYSVHILLCISCSHFIKNILKLITFHTLNEYNFNFKTEWN